MPALFSLFYIHNGVIDYCSRKGSSCFFDLYNHSNKISISYQKLQRKVINFLFSMTFLYLFYRIPSLVSYHPSP